MKLLLLLFALFFLTSACPNLIYFNPTNNATGWIAAGRPEVVDTANRFDLNCRGLNQTFPAGTFILNNRDNAQLVVYKGECLWINLTCGWQDAAQTKPMTSNSLILTFSVSKILISEAITIMYDRGYFDWKDYVSTYWPEFGLNGKELITVEQLFGNFAGLPYIAALNLSDIAIGSNLTKLKNLLEIQVPAYGSSSESDDGVFGYSPIVWGWYFYFFSTYVDPVGRNGIQFIQDEIGDPTGVNMHFGIAVNDSVTRSQAADLRFGTFPPTPCQDYGSLAVASQDPCSIQYRAVYNPVELATNPLITNTPEGQAVILPAGILYISALDLAKTIIPFSMDGRGAVELASEAAIDISTQTLFNGTDTNAFYPTSYGRAGYFKNAEKTIYAPGRRAFGHTGAAGAIAFSWRDYTWVYLTADYSTNTCEYGVPFNTYSLYYTFWGWNF
jgi:CubicO group peptidase (beta-lactamase class C family)